MSRYAVETEGKEVVVGWDPPLQTFFGQVYDLTRHGEDEQPDLWVGADERLPDIESLERAMGQYRPVVEALASKLYADQDENR